MNDLIKQIEKESLKENPPKFNVGDTVKVFVKVVEGNKERLQAYEGVVISKSGGGSGETFCVRRISFGIGVERTFLLHSPRIDRVEVVRKGKVRRAKLYYLRGRTGKSARVKEARDPRPPKAKAAVKSTMPKVEEPKGDAPAKVAPKATAVKAKAPAKAVTAATKAKK